LIESNRRSLEGAVEKCDEDSFVRPDGTTEWIRWETRPWHDASGSIGGIIIFTEVITHRKQGDAALRASDERMRFALENAEVGIWDYDFSTGIAQWSATLEAQFGLVPGSFPRAYENAIACIHPGDREYVIGTIRHAMETGADFSLECRALWVDGSHRWLSGAGRIQLDAKGKPLRGVGISVDVTERHSLEEQSQQAQKMEAIGRLAGGVAHDFNNLLTVILGYCDILLAEFEPKDVRRSEITEIRNAGARASSLTRQLLAFSRREIIELQTLDLNRIATEMQSMLSRLIGENVSIVLALGAAQPTIRADSSQIEQVVMNLAVNGRDAMPDGGTIRIETANVVLDEPYARLHPMAKPGSYVALIVSDSGMGMTQETKARLFEPFFTTKDIGKGTGLGMATVYGIVARCGGSIDVATEPGTGTTFTVYFPSAQWSEGVAHLPKRITRAAGATATVLLVEDEDGLREVARRLLQRLGYVVLVAANASDAIRLFDEHASIDVVLTDVIMPGTSGLELIRRLIEKRPSLKVIYMSGYTEDAIVEDGVLKPGVSYLHKPFSLDSLGEKLRQVLEG
jgi:two-component system cell cycle sensor histidine kinase/response regulator CckA